MKIFKSLALVAGLAFITANISAQQAAQMDYKAAGKAQTEQVKQNVTGITSDQENKIASVEEAFVKAMVDAKHNTPNHDEAHAKMETIRQDRDAKVKAILTADQGSQYDKYMAKLSAPAQSHN